MLTLTSAANENTDMDVFSFDNEYVCVCVCALQRIAVKIGKIVVFNNKQLNILFDFCHQLTIPIISPNEYCVNENRKKKEAHVSPVNKIML